MTLATFSLNLTLAFLKRAFPGLYRKKCVLQIYHLAQETIVLLLEFNPDSQALLEWVIDRCYTGSHEVADGCFNALAMVFNDRWV